MVPILQQQLPAEHVTLWSEQQRSALRAVWLENKSSLTLDSGSFSIFESGEFAGEGLLDPNPSRRKAPSFLRCRPGHARQDHRSQGQPDSPSRFRFKRRHHREPTWTRPQLLTPQPIPPISIARLLLEHPRRNNGWSLDDEAIKPMKPRPISIAFVFLLPPIQLPSLKSASADPNTRASALDPNQNYTTYLLELVKARSRRRSPAPSHDRR